MLVVVLWGLREVVVQDLEVRVRRAARLLRQKLSKWRAAALHHQRGRLLLRLGLKQGLGLELHKLRVLHELRLGLRPYLLTLAHVARYRHHLSVGVSALIAQHAQSLMHRGHLVRVHHLEVVHFCLNRRHILKVVQTAERALRFGRELHRKRRRTHAPNLLERLVFRRQRYLLTTAVETPRQMVLVHSTIPFRYLQLPLNRKFLLLLLLP